MPDDRDVLQEAFANAPSEAPKPQAEDQTERIPEGEHPQPEPVIPPEAPKAPEAPVPEIPVPPVPEEPVPPVPPAPETPAPPVPPVLPEKRIAQAKPLSNETVTGHTASLWKYNPIPENEPEPFPEYRSTHVKLPGGELIASRVRGKKHKHEGTNCDDWYELAHLGQVTFVAVSDGAGSKKFSRIGARESCRAAVGYMVNAFEKVDPSVVSALGLPLSDQRCMNACGVLASLVQKSVIQAYDAVESAFYSRRTQPEYEAVLGRSLQFKDLSGTLLLAVVIPLDQDTGEHLVISCQIGDGMIALVNSKGAFQESVKLMGVADSGDFSGETDFLTSPKMKTLEALQTRTKISRSVVDTLLVMTDGVSDDYFPNKTQIHRLYFDLLVNGILEIPGWKLQDTPLTQEQLKRFKRIPDPLAYPWVNDQNVTVSLQYTKRILDSMGLTLEELWKDPALLGLARMEMSDMDRVEDPSQRLKIWLDNYVERGSFDDRTLVILKM